jgi:hypothetical protein
MVLRGRVIGIQLQGVLEALDGFIAAIQDGEQKAYLILEARRFGVERSRLPIGIQCPRGIALRFQSGAARLQVRKRVLCVADQPEGKKPAGKKPAGKK